MKRILVSLFAIVLMTTACKPVDLSLPVPEFETQVNPEEWATIPAGDFLAGQFDEEATINSDFQIMITDVTVAQYVEFLNSALSEGVVKLADDKVTIYYPGDAYQGAKHEMRIDAGDYVVVPLNDPTSPFDYDGQVFSSKKGWEKHPMVNVSWFGASAYCSYNTWRLPSELEWVKAARGADDKRPYPWGDELTKNVANYYKNGDPFEEMTSVGSRTTPVGFFDGSTYGDYSTQNSASPYGLYDMAGNVWQWLADITPGSSDRLMHGGSRNSYSMDLRIWVRNSAPPMIYNTETGFRCVKSAQ